MKVVMEKYHGFGNDYLIWDPIKNKMQLDSKRVKEINKGNLAIGTVGILYGPIIEENNLTFHIYRFNGEEMNITENIAMVIKKYALNNGYITKESNNLLSSMNIPLSLQYPHEDIRNIGFVILNNQFVEELQVIK